MESRPVIRPWRRRRCQRGFTLIELLVALTITTLGLVGLLSLNISLTRTNQEQSRYSEGSRVASSTLEMLRSQRMSELANALTGNPAVVPPIDVWLSTEAGRNGLTYRRHVTVSTMPTVSASLILIRVQVEWTEDDSASTTANLQHHVAVEVVRTVEETL
jgi:prepilin-type N-terminal cleavage/methylation domain-containing protein